MKSNEVRKEARETLQGKWGKGVAIIIAFLTISFIFSYLTGFFEENSILAFSLSLTKVMFSVPLSFGLEFVFLKLKRNENVRTFEFIQIGFENFSRCWNIVGRTILKLIIPIIFMISGMVAYFMLTTNSVMQLTAGEVVSARITFIIGLIIYLLSIIYYAVKSLLYSLTTYIAYDNRDMVAKEVVNESASLMRGNRGKLVLLELSFIGWAILAICTLGIGFLWLLPYMKVAMVCFYDKLIQTRTTAKDISNDDGPIKQM